MGEVYPLDAVIRKVNSKTRANSSTQKIVIIDVNNGKEKRSFFATDVKHYLVSNNKDEQNYADRNGIICNVTDFEHDDLSFGLSINYRVSCDSGKEIQVAEALWDNTHPGAELDRKIKKYVDNFFSFENDITDIINNFGQLVKKLKKYITTNIQKEVGLNIKLKISLDKEDQLTPFRISSPHFRVQFSDYAQELDLQFEIELLVDEDKKINAVLHSGKPNLLERLVQKEIKKYLLENISVEEFYGELDTSIRRQLISYLNNEVLIRYGYRVGYLALKSTDISSKVEEFLQVEHEVFCTVQEQSVKVKNTIQMMPENVGKYRMAASPNLERWVIKYLDLVIKPILFEKEYVDILLDFQPIRDKIKEQMIKRSESIGYRVKQIVSIPDLEEFSLTKEFSLKVEDEFETKDSKVKVKLNIIVDAKIDNLNKIKNLLNARTDVKASMEATIERSVRSFLHTIEPERFYMRFFITDENHPEEQLSLEKEIEKIIKEKLENEPFFATVKNITPKPLETEVAQRFQELSGRFCKFQFEVLSFIGDDPIQFHGYVQVNGVEQNNWYTFQSRKYNLTEIKDYLEDLLKARLKNYSNQALEFSQNKDLSALERLLNQWSYQYIVEQFGLEISIKNVDRDLTESEKIKASFAQQTKQEQIKLTARQPLAQIEYQNQQIEYERKVLQSVNQQKTLLLDELLKKRNILIKREGNEEEIKEINSKIYELTHETETKAFEASREIIEQNSYLLEQEKSRSTETSMSEILENETKRLSETNNQQRLPSEEN